MKLLRVLPVTALLAVGCGAIPVEMHTSTTIQHSDGTVEHKETHWHGTLDQLPAQMGKAGKEFGDVTAQMAKELTDVPPPGQVALDDLHPSLAKFKGKKGQDFLVNAKDESGKPIEFKYVRLGVPQYDDFFKTAAEIYALVYQTTQIVGHLRQASGAILSTNVDANADLKATVDKATGQSNADPEVVGRLQTYAEEAQTLGVLIPQIAQKIAKLIQTGEQLVASAASSITNPKIIAHLDLVKTGIVDSVKVIKESGGLMVGFSKDLTGFGKS
ncbi:MAG TPA: hypothetical protein VIF62_37920 [Labilithrix sp.]|jgi:hypothetical protein